MNKVETIKHLMGIYPEMSVNDLARAAQCHVETARRVKSGSYVTPRKDAKANAIARNELMASGGWTSKRKKSPHEQG